MKTLIEALIGKHNIESSSQAEKELVCVCVAPRYSNNESITSLIQQYYALNLNNADVEVYIMDREDLIRFARKNRWENFTVLVPKMKTWSREDIIKALRADKKLQNFSFITSEIKEEIKRR